MPAHLEIRAPGGPVLEALHGERAAVGRDSGNDIDVHWDPMASRQHAVFEHHGSGWSVRDLGSSNGTYVNGKRVWSSQALDDRDEVTVGTTVICFRSETTTQRAPTAIAEPPPDLTRREQDVLVALCRPVLSGDAFTEPATVDEMAAELYVSKGAVKQHLASLYIKFGVEEGDARRSRLANDAIRRRAIDLTDLT